MCQTEHINVAGAGQFITVAIEEQYLLVEAGSPNITFNADVEAGAEVPVYIALQFITRSGKNIARPSGQADGPVLTVNQGFQDHFEAMETTLPRVSVKLNNPDMKAHTEVYRWSLLTGGTQEVPLIVSCKLCFSLILAHSKKSVKCTNLWTPSNGNNFLRYWPLVREFNGHGGILLTKDSDAALLCFLWSAAEHIWLSKLSRRQWFETP